MKFDLLESTMVFASRRIRFATGLVQLLILNLSKILNQVQHKLYEVKFHYKSNFRKSWVNKCKY